MIRAIGADFNEINTYRQCKNKKRVNSLGEQRLNMVGQRLKISRKTLLAAW
jgi:hypothetical protein